MPEAKLITELSREERECLGPERTRIIGKLISMGYPVTAVTIDEYTQMPIRDCRKHIRANQRMFFRKPRSLKEASENGFVLDGAVSSQMTESPTRFQGVSFFVRKLNAGGSRCIAIPFSAKLSFGKPRNVRRGEF